MQLGGAALPSILGMTPPIMPERVDLPSFRQCNASFWFIKALSRASGQGKATVVIQQLQQRRQQKPERTRAGASKRLCD